MKEKFIKMLNDSLCTLEEILHVQKDERNIKNPLHISRNLVAHVSHVLTFMRLVFCFQFFIFSGMKKPMKFIKYEENLVNESKPLKIFSFRLSLLFAWENNERTHFEIFNIEQWIFHWRQSCAMATSGWKAENFHDFPICWWFSYRSQFDS